MTNLTPLPDRTPRISTKVRTAVQFRVREGMSIAKAAEAAGMSTNGFAKALKRPAVQDHLREVQQAFVIEIDGSKAVYKARAMEVALELMNNAKSETVKARMVEFLLSDGKTPQVAVHVDARQSGPRYAFARPGNRVVEIRDVAVTESKGSDNVPKCSQSND